MSEHNLTNNGRYKNSMTFYNWVITVPFLLLVSLSPGPNNFTAMYNGIHTGPKSAVIAALGRNIAFSIWMLLSAIGIGAMIVSSVFWFNILKWLGVIYLIYIGVKTWLNSDMMSHQSILKTKDVVFKSHGSRIKQEFLIAISNPKAIFIFTAIFPQLLDLNTSIAMQFLVFGVTFIICEFISAYIYAAAGMQVRRLINSRNGVIRMNKGIGLLFILAAFLLASSH